MMESLTVVLVILWLQWNGVSSQQKEVEQSPDFLRVPEGDSAHFNCTYSNSASQNFGWYRQYPGKGPELLVSIYSSGDKKEGRFTAQLSTASRHFSLHIQSSQHRDSAAYFCALSMGGSTYKLIFGKGTLLTVNPIIENPEPAVYQLRDPKSRNTSVCLFTDFDSNVNLSESVLPGVPHTQPTVLNMKSLDSKSNAAVAWSSKSNFDCRNTFGDPTFYPSSDYPCNATLVEESFETDMNLNLENLSVMALRILLLKVAGFNLLMTLRLWSS